MSKRPSISVAMCTFNGQGFLHDQLQSILSQSDPPDEVVVADDGSTDRTLDLIETLGSSSSIPIRVIRKGPRLGISKNFEVAVEAARGDIIFLSDQDDVWDQRRIELMCDPFIEDSDVGLVYCDAHVVTGDRPTDSQTVFSQRPHLRNPNSWSPTRLIKGTWIKGCMIAFRRSLIPLLTPFPEDWDYDHWIAFMTAATSRVVSVKSPLMYHRRHGSNASDDPFGRSEVARVLRLVFKTDTKHNYKSDIAKWQIAIDRLTDALSGNVSPPLDPNKAHALLGALPKRLHFALMRYHLHKTPRIARIPRILEYTANGYYGRYVAGWGSVMRDLFCV